LANSSFKNLFKHEAKALGKEFSRQLFGHGKKKKRRRKNSKQREIERIRKQIKQAQKKNKKLVNKIKRQHNLK